MYLDDAKNWLPNFFIIGGPKCGTTSLFDWLRQHPDTFLPAKEPNFLSPDVFDARDEPEALQNWSQYTNKLKPEENCKLVTGEATPRTLYSDAALKVLASHCSQPKVIVILRNPIDLVFSLHGQMLRQGVETEPDFSRAWERSLLKGGDPEVWKSRNGRVDRRLDYQMFGKIGTRLRAVKGLIPSERLRIFILEEDLSNEPTAVLQQVLAFLELPAAPIETRKQNERFELKSIGLNRHAVQIRKAFVRANVFLGLKEGPHSRFHSGTGVMKLLSSINRRAPTIRSKLSREKRIELAAFFTPEVKQVEQVLARSMREWHDWNTTK